MNGKVLYILDIYFLLISFILLIVCMGIGFEYFHSDMLVVSPQIKYSFFFGFGLGLGIILFGGFWLFLFCPRSVCNYVLTFPLFFVLFSLTIFLTMPKAKDNYLKKWDQNWADNFKIRSMQMRYSCCGWNNFSDRGLFPCPPLFASGCKSVVSSYLEPRYKEIFLFSSIALGLGLITSIPLFIFSYQRDDTDLISQLDLYS